MSALTSRKPDDVPNYSASATIPQKPSLSDLQLVSQFDRDQLKRKHVDPLHSFSVVRTFEILPDPRSHVDQPIHLTSLFLLPRLHLSLSSIDHDVYGNLAPIPPFFSAYIAELEDHHEWATKTPSFTEVLIGRVREDDRLYAVERAAFGVYTICRLRQWVGEEHLRSLALGDRGLPQITSTAAQDVGVHGAWWSSACVASTPPEDHIEKKRKVEISPRPPASEPQLEGDPLPRSTSLEQKRDPTHRTSTASSQLATGSEPSQAPQNIVEQYLDTLYLSNTSLAYFVKGPLSKARAIQLECKKLSEHAGFLRGLLLTLPAADKKYKETMPAILRSALTDAGSIAHGNQAATIKKSRTVKAKKQRRGKNSLLPGEEGPLLQWWAIDDAAVSAMASIDGTIQARLPQLRLRETLLQLVLTLEALMVERMSEEAAPSRSEDSNGALRAAEQDTSSTVVAEVDRAKLKKVVNLQSLAETLVDRMTIWQSIEMGHEKDKDTRQSQHIDEAGENLAKVAGNDHLRDFCIDVLIPFYHAKLPQLVVKLSEKVGIQAASPTRPTRDATRINDRLAPGTAIARNRVPASGPRKPLSRVTSETNQKQMWRPPSLFRSATDTKLQELKREQSATPQPPAPESAPNRPQSRDNGIIEKHSGKENKRRSMSRTSSIIIPSKSLSRREVDFSAITKHNETKSKRSTNIEEELREAIATLKKPNRSFAVKDIAADAEARLKERSRPRMTYPRKTYLDVQVDATPQRLSKTKKLTAAEGMGPLDRSPLSNEQQSIPSTNLCVPASAIRPGSLAEPLLDEASCPDVQSPLRLAKRPRAVFIPASTREGTSTATNVVEQFAGSQRPVGPVHTPVKHARPQLANTNSLGSTPFAVPSTPASRSGIDRHALVTPATPLTHSLVGENRAPPAVPVSAPIKPVPDQESIYAELGWDDDVDGLM